jgi:hypothetical protein
MVGSIEFCFPYWSGCTSISRAARSSDALFLFRAVMIMNAVLLMHYWLQLGQMLTLYGRRATTLQTLGIIAALFLVLYANFLGTQGDVYRLLRQYGVTIYFSFTVLAHMLLTNHLFSLNENKIYRHLQIQRYLCGWLLTLGIFSVFFNALLEGETKDRCENIIEWHFSLGMNFYFLLTTFIWKRLNFSYRPTL